MREITEHHDGHGLNDGLKIVADDLDPINGNASHRYTIMDATGKEVATVQYQHGPRHEDGSLSGATDQALLAIVADRHRCFNAGPISCRENALVLTKVQEALHWLRSRADERAMRGVLGRNVK